MKRLLLKRYRETDKALLIEITITKDEENKK